MKKTILVLLILLTFGVETASPMAAITDPLSVSVAVTASVSLTVRIFNFDNGSFGSEVSNMSFGQLAERNGTLDSTGAKVVFISANTQGVPYQLKQSGTTLSNGATELPAGACTVVPVYSRTDNGGLGMPVGASLGTRGTWVANDKVLYTSQSGTASVRTIQNYYAITDDPAAGATSYVPIDQPGGDYAGTITFTVTTL